jgi:hypothetical protein
MNKGIVFIILVLANNYLTAQNVGIGTPTPDASAILEISSSNKGLLVPRLNLLSPTDVVTVPAPAVGLLVINLNGNISQMPDGGGFYVWTGSSWVKLLIRENGNSTTAWTTKGNTSTNASDNFLGTTDKVPLIFKINNSLAGKIDTSGSIAFGRGALKNNPGNRLNTAFGDSSLFNNYTDNPILIFASQNTAIGNKALYANTTGNRNVAIGHEAMHSNQNGFANSAVGAIAMQFNTSGVSNAALGFAALNKNTEGDNNTAIGANSLTFNTTGNSNVAVGNFSLSHNVTGSANTAVGTNALIFATSANNNVAIGFDALYFDTTGFSNVAIGTRALYNNLNRNNIVAVGDSALFHNGNNVSFSTQATGNTAVGSKASYINSIGSQNTSLGFQAAYNCNNDFGTYLGYHAGRNTNGVSNTFVGWGAGTDASNSTITSGGDNVAVGVRAGQAITTGTKNIAIGNLANLSSGSLTNTITIGHNITNTQSNSVVLGNSNITKWGFGTNTTADNIIEFNNAITTARLTTGGVWVNASSEDIKENFSALDKKDILNKIMQLHIKRWNYKKEDRKITHIGPTAQNFYNLFQTGSDDKTISTIDPAGVALVGVQALQNEVESLKNEIEELKKIIFELQRNK